MSVRFIVNSVIEAKEKTGETLNTTGDARNIKRSVISHSRAHHDHVTNALILVS